MAFRYRLVTLAFVSLAVVSFTAFAVLDANAAETDRMTIPLADSYVSSSYTVDGANRFPMFPNFYTLELQGVTPYGVGEALATSGIVSLSLRAHDAPTVRDACTVYNGRELGASVQHGALILEKKVGDKPDFAIIGTLVNIFEDNPDGIEDLYVASTSDLREGITLRLTLLYATRLSPALRYTELYEIRIKNPDTAFLLSADSGESNLADGGTVTHGTGILVHFGEDARVEASYNDGAFVAIQNGARFSAVGRYRFRMITIDGTEERQTVYILPSVDEAMDTYFPGGAVGGIFVFDQAADIPAYLQGAVLRIPETPPFLPPLTGTVKNHTTGEMRDVSTAGEERELPLSSGEYTVILSAGTSGITELFTFQFFIHEAYDMSVNHFALKDSDMIVPRDFGLLRADTNRAVAYLADGASEPRELIFGVPLCEQLEAGDWWVTEFQDGTCLDLYRVTVLGADSASANGPLSCRATVTSPLPLIGVALVSVLLVRRNRKERAA